MGRSRPSALMLLVGLACFLLVSCQDQSPDEREASPGLPDQEIEGFRLTHTRDGARLWVLSASLAEVYEQADRVELSGLRVDFFDDKGDVRSTLTASRGVLSRRTNDMEALGSVVLISSDGTVLTTERLVWNERRGKIQSDRAVRVTKGKDVMTGVGMESDPDLTNIRVKSDFRAYVRTPEGELIEEQ